jgi:uncharacterized protein YlxW (UPF0749 family)
MWWWIALGVVAGAVLVLMLAMLSLLVPLGRLARAAATTQARMRKAQAVQESVAHLQERAAALAEQAAGLQERLDAYGIRPPSRWKG